MPSETLSQILSRTLSDLKVSGVFSKEMEGAFTEESNSLPILDEIYSEYLEKFSKDFGQFGIEVDSIRSTVIPIDTVKTISKGLDEAFSDATSNVKVDELDKDVKKIRFQEHLLESYENAFLRMMGMPNEKNIVGKDIVAYNDGRLETFSEGSSNGESIYSIFSKRDSSSVDRINSNRSQKIVFLSGFELDTSYFNREATSQLDSVIQEFKKIKTSEEKALKENEKFNVSDFKSRFFKSVSKKSEFKNLVDTEASGDVNSPEDAEGQVSRVYFDEKTDKIISNTFSSKVMGKSKDRNLINYADFILEEASLLFPPVQDSRIEYCLSEPDKIISKPFDVGSATVNRKEIKTSLLESVIRIRLDSVTGSRENTGRKGLKTPVDIEMGDFGLSSPVKNSEAFSLVESIIIDRLQIALTNFAEAFYELSQNYYKVCKKARVTLSKMLEVEDHKRVIGYSGSESGEVNMTEENKMLYHLKEIDDTILILLEKSKVKTREFGNFSTTSIQDGVAMDALLKVITIPSSYSSGKLSKFEKIKKDVANSKNGVIDTSTKLAQMMGLKRGVGMLDLLCFSLSFFTVSQKDLLGLLGESQIKAVKSEFGIRGKLEVSAQVDAINNFSIRLAECYNLFSATIKD
jgi:hypothetical protein